MRKRKRKTMRQSIAMALAFVLALTNVYTGQLGGALRAEAATGPVYTLDITEVAKNKCTVDGVFTSPTSNLECGTDDYFTLLFRSGGKAVIDSNSKTFKEDGVADYSATHRYNSGGPLLLEDDVIKDRAIKFTTNNSATVKVWWVCGGDGRKIKILQADGSTQEAITTNNDTSKNGLYIDTLAISQKGTYYIGSNTGGGANIFKIVVTEDPVGDPVSWSLKYNGSEKATITGTKADSEYDVTSTEEVSFDAAPLAGKFALEKTGGDVDVAELTVAVDEDTQWITVKDASDKAVIEIPYSLAVKASLKYDGNQKAAITGKRVGTTKDVSGTAEKTVGFTDMVSDPTSLEFDAAPVAGSFAIAAETGNVYSGTASMTVAVDTANSKIQIKDGEVVAQEISYTAAGELAAMTTSTPAESCNFESTDTTQSTSSKVMFGFAGTETPWKNANKIIFSKNGYIKLENMASDSSATALTAGQRHGLKFSAPVTFTVKVPADTMGVFTIDRCLYAGASCVANVSVIGADGSETQLSDYQSVSLVSADSEKDANDHILITYKNLSTTTAVDMQIEITPSGWVHGVSYEVTDIPQTANVKGKVDVALAGSNLTFAATGATTQTAIVAADGSYSVELDIGKTYTVTTDKENYRLADGSVNLTDAAVGATIEKDFTAVRWDATKAFDLTIGGTKFTFTPGADDTAAFTVAADGGDGKVEIAVSGEAIIWANLGGKGSGTLSAASITSKSDNITTAVKGNVLTVNYTDTATDPVSYKVTVKDNSASGVPKTNGTLYTYNFKNESVVSKLWDKSKGYINTDVTSPDKLLTITGDEKIAYNDSAHGIAIKNGGSFQLKLGKEAAITLTLCQYSDGAGQFAVTSSNGGTLDVSSVNAKADTDGATSTINYTGDETVLTFTYSGSNAGYLHGVSVTYPAADITYVEQPVMPFVAGDDADAGSKVLDTDNIPKGSVKANLNVSIDGQKLELTNATGSLNTAFDKVKGVGYYLFPMTEDVNSLEFDLLVTGNSATGNDAAFCAGLFTNDYMSTLGLRAGGTKYRGLYSKNIATDATSVTAGEYAGAGSPTEGTLGLNVPIHYSVGKVVDAMEGTVKTLVEISYLKDGVEETQSFTQSMPEGAGNKAYYGMALTGVKAVITNMVYKDASGNVLYSQNDCYYPVGTAPVVNAGSVNAVPEGAAGEPSEYIDVTWTGTVPEDDGTYVLEMSIDNGEWVELADDLTKLQYRYEIPPGEKGNYLFRVCGQLGRKNLGGTRTDYVTMSTPVYALGALKRPTVIIEPSAASIKLSWDPTPQTDYYVVYRRSFDEGGNEGKIDEDASKMKEVFRSAQTEFTDTDVVAETPYYYIVRSFSEVNASPEKTKAVWAVPSAGHSGEYVYENEAANIVLTKKSYDTVFTNKVVLEGIVEGTGTLVARVNGTDAASKALDPRDAFAFELTVEEGRNDVELIFTDDAGKKTRQIYNYVYLTNYDKIVDASYTGTDGEDGSGYGVPTYKTVQAAVDAVPAGGTDSIVILVLAGSYKERLTVNKPFVTLIGEDRDNTLIHCYPADTLGADGEAGGDMKVRCATYIQEGAKSFTAENISFANDYVYATPDGKSNKSADVLRVDAEEAVFTNVKLSGVQDTLYMDKGKQYYYKCRIEGLIDYIYSGDKAKAYFEDCDLVFVYESTKNSGYVSAPKTEAGAAYGLTFNNCRIYGEEGCSGNGYLLARPWGPDGYIAWINCYMGKSVYALQPYAAMSGNLAEDARFFEFGSYGPGYEINANRRQISPAKAAQMTSASYLGWDPATITAAISTDHYKGSKALAREPQYVINGYVSTVYLQTDGDDTGLKRYEQEGYANAYGVTGGGLLKETNSNYYAVSTADEFMSALTKIKATGKNSVIELKADVNLGCNEVANFETYSASKMLTAYTNQPLTHPTLLQTGTSVLRIENMHNITIFSSNASSIKHANILFKNSSNIIIRNIKFDELWEWDEATGGDYDRNDWDYMTLDEGANGIWIDHCTFYKAYDGVIDVKNPKPTDNVTISWCEFLPGSEDNVFFDEMMNDVFAHPEKYPKTYKHMVEAGMTDEQVRMYAYGQKKTHLFGQDDTAVSAKGIMATLANNYYYDSMDRMPRLRYGNSHVYNCIMDSQELLDAKKTIADPDVAKKIVSNGASSTCGGSVLLENCYINGIENAMNSGNGSSPAGYINAKNSLYYVNGVRYATKPKVNTSKPGETVLLLNADNFISNLPYSNYVLYDAAELAAQVKPYAGAGKLTLTVLQWEKAAYNDTTFKAPTVSSNYDKDNDSLPEYLNYEVSDNIPASFITPAVTAKTGCTTTAQLKDYLKNYMKNNIMGDGELPLANTMVKEVTIKIGATEVAPGTPIEGGMEIVIGYPEEIDPSDYDFFVGHMLVTGDMEDLTHTVAKVPTGIRVFITSASPFVIGWKLSESDDALQVIADGKTEYYIVRSGDTWESIAKDFGLTVDQLMKLNPDAKPSDVIYPGQWIKVSDGIIVGTNPAASGSAGKKSPKTDALGDMVWAGINAMIKPDASKDANAAADGVAEPAADTAVNPIMAGAAVANSLRLPWLAISLLGVAMVGCAVLWTSYKRKETEE